MSEQFPVYVTVQRPDGSTDQVRVGTARRAGDGFVLQLGELRLGAAQPATAAPAPAARAPAAASRPAAGGGGYGPANFPNYGRSKGAPIAGASAEDLEYYANGCRRTLNDPNKSRWHDKERELLAAIEAEMERQGLPTGDPRSRPRPRPAFMSEPQAGSAGAPPSFGDEPPPHTDDDVPF